jgi:hypothetical protein
MSRKREPTVAIGGIDRALFDIRDLMQPEDGEGVLYLPTTCLTTSVELFMAALERHGMVVTRVAGRQAFRVQGPPDTTLDHNFYCSNYNDRYDWIDYKDHPDQPPLLLDEHRILPYLESDPGAFVSLVFTRPVRPTDNLKQIRTQAWPLMESMSAEDESPAVKLVRAQAAEKLRIANLYQENAQLRAEVERLQGLLMPSV